MILVSDDSKGPGTYRVWRDIPDSAAGGANATGYTLENLVRGATYTFQVRAANGAGWSGASNDVTETSMLPPPAGALSGVGYRMAKPPDR